MGKIVFKVLKADKDYIPTDAIADVAVSGGAASATFTIESTGTEIISGETALTKNFDAGIRTSGITVDAPTLAGGVTASVRLLIFEGNTPGEGTLKKVQIIDGGSGYESSASPKVTVTDKSGTPHELDVTLGKGSPETTEFDEFVFARDGEFVNSADGILLSQASVSRDDTLKQNFDPDDVNSISSLLTARRSNAKQITPMNILNNTVNFAHVQDFLKTTITLKAVDSGLTEIDKAEQQITEFNETQGEQLIAQANANYQTALKNHEIAVGRINHEEAAKLAGPMSSFQQRWRIDMSQFSNMQANPMNADPIWTILGTMISRFGWVQGARYSYSQPRLASLLRRRRIPGTGGFPDYPPNVEYPPTPTFQQPASGGGISAPGWFKPAKAAGKFLLWKTLCFAAIATLVHIFERLTSTGNFSTFESSGGQIPYCARAWAPDIRDGKYVSWLKSEMRSHDILMFLLQLRTYMGAKVKQTSKSVAKISKSTLTSLGVGQPDVESSKLEILLRLNR